jgi:hypothetical protein
MDHHFHLKASSWVTCRQRRGRTTRPRRFVNGSILRSRAADKTSSTNETGKLCAGFHRSRRRTRQRTNRAGEGYSDPSHSCLMLGAMNEWQWPHCWIRAYADITMAPRRPSVQPVALWKLWIPIHTLHVLASSLARPSAPTLFQALRVIWRPIAFAVQTITARNPNNSPARSTNTNSKMAQKVGDVDGKTYGPTKMDVS